MDTTHLPTSQYAAYSSHEDFDGRRIVAHADVECRFIFVEGADPVPGLLPTDRWNECPYCIQGARFREIDFTPAVARMADENAPTPLPSGDGTGSGRKGLGVASEKQVAFLRRLHDERGLTVPADLESLTPKAASKLIEKLLAMPVKAAAPAAGVRKNRFGGNCRTCGRYVGEGEGILVGGPGSWGVECHDGEHQAKVAPVVTPAADLPAVPAGRYALPSTGTNDLAFYRVDRPTEGRWAGRVFVKLVVGGRADSNVPPAQIRGILARIVEAGVEESARTYGREIGDCALCGRVLTDDESRARGIGPVCEQKGF